MCDIERKYIIACYNQDAKEIIHIQNNYIFNPSYKDNLALRAAILTKNIPIISIILSNRNVSFDKDCVYELLVILKHINNANINKIIFKNIRFISAFKSLAEDKKKMQEIYQIN